MKPLIWFLTCIAPILIAWWTHWQIDKRAAQREYHRLEAEHKRLWADYRWHVSEFWDRASARDRGDILPSQQFILDYKLEAIRDITDRQFACIQEM